MIYAAKLTRDIVGGLDQCFLLRFGLHFSNSRSQMPENSRGVFQMYPESVRAVLCDLLTWTSGLVVFVDVSYYVLDGV